MHGTKADKLYDSTQLLDVKAQLDLGECGMQEVSFYHQHKNSVDFVFVDHPVYHRPGELAVTACDTQRQSLFHEHHHEQKQLLPNLR